MAEAPSSQMPVCSVVIPVFNEEDNVFPLAERLTHVLSDLGLSYEVLFVDDGSTDATADRVSRLYQSNPCISLLRFSRNFGHQAAVMAGLEFARGQCVVTMDGDLQHPPELIPELVAKWRDGYEMVYTVRHEAPGTSRFKTITSRQFYRIMNRLSTVNVPEGAADFRLLDRKVLDALASLTERDLFLRGLVAWVGFKQTGIPYTASPRYAGSSKYALLRMVRFASGGITAFSALPLHLATFAGILVAGVSFIYAVYAVVVRLVTDRAVPGWTSVLFSVLFLGGVQLIALGIVGEYVGRIFNEVKGRPRYIIREMLRHE